jgi:2-polyprenyl-3-methyl-5-hydroxy-6-metoxy-1,4-benzoquinol methylase
MKINNSERKYYNYQVIARGTETKESLKKRFDLLTRYYNSLLIKYLPNDKNVKILDLPCGYGNILYFLQANGYKNIIGIDLDENQIQLAKLFDFNVKLDDGIDFLKKTTEKFDCIFSVDFIEHLDKGIRFFW